MVCPVIELSNIGGKTVKVTAAILNRYISSID
jgi:hypothetical protein